MYVVLHVVYLFSALSFCASMLSGPRATNFVSQLKVDHRVLVPQVCGATLLKMRTSHPSSLENGE